MEYEIKYEEDEETVKKMLNLSTTKIEVVSQHITARSERRIEEAIGM